MVLTFRKCENFCTGRHIVYILLFVYILLDIFSFDQTIILQLLQLYVRP